MPAWPPPTTMDFEAIVDARVAAADDDRFEVHEKPHLPRQKPEKIAVRISGDAISPVISPRCRTA